MNGKIDCIMLVDDNEHDNFFHERVIMKNNYSDLVIKKQTGDEALHYLKEETEKGCVHPDLIFLDINMPGMNGWEFISEYQRLEKDKFIHNGTVIIILSTSENPDDKQKAKSLNILSDFKTKPLTREMMEEIIQKYFKQ